MAAPIRNRPTPIPVSAPVDQIISAPVQTAQVSERSNHNRRLQHMKEYFARQPKETIRIRKDEGEQFVQVNGYTFQIQAGVTVQVPRSVAEMLRNADII